MLVSIWIPPINTIEMSRTHNRSDWPLLYLAWSEKGVFKLSRETTYPNLKVPLSPSSTLAGRSQFT